jgi:hypothetical protein
LLCRNESRISFLTYFGLPPYEKEVPLLAVVLFALLLHSVSAADDCAFLLWAEDSWMQSGGEKAGFTVNWTLLQAESSLAQCETNSRAKLESVAEGYRKNTQADKVEVQGNVLSVQAVRGNSPSAFILYAISAYQPISILDQRPNDKAGSWDRSTSITT